MHFPGHTLSSPLRRSAAECLGAVLLELFPQAQLLGGGETPLGFYYEVEVFPVVQKELFPLLEQKLLSLLKGGGSLQRIEMMRENAASMLCHFQQPVLAERVRACESNILSLVQIGKYKGVPDGEVAFDVAPIQSVKLLSVLPSKKHPKGVRVEGVIFADPAEKKQFTKEYQRYFAHRDHRLLGEEMGLFRLLPKEGALVWYPKGVLFKQQVRQAIDSMMSSTDWWFLPVEVGGGADVRRHHYQLWERETRQLGLGVYRGILDRSERAWQPLQEWGLLGRRGQERFSMREQKSKAIALCSSLLQRIEAWVRMLGLSACWRGSGSWLGAQLPLEVVHEPPRQASLPNRDWIELCLFDTLGRRWPGPFVETVPLQDDWMIFGDWLGGIEQVAALVLERVEGYLPCHLSPEQVRVLPADAASCAYAYEVGEQCQKEGLRCEVDTRQYSLKQRVFEAEKERIPYLLLVGEKERRLAQVMVRSGHSQKMWELKEFLTLVKGEGKIV